jgi:hypothetical protein
MISNLQKFLLEYSENKHSKYLTKRTEILNKKKEKMFLKKRQDIINQQNENIKIDINNIKNNIKILKKSNKFLNKYMKDVIKKIYVNGISIKDLNLIKDKECCILSKINENKTYLFQSLYEMSDNIEKINEQILDKNIYKQTIKLYSKYHYLIYYNLRLLSYKEIILENAIYNIDNICVIFNI